jgi:hypothetical protein
MPGQRDPAGAERIRDQAVGSRLNIAPLDLQYAFGMSQVPELTAGPTFEAGEHELRSHRAVAYEATFAQDFLKRFLHDEIQYARLRGTGPEDYANPNYVQGPN